MERYMSASGLHSGKHFTRHAKLLVRFDHIRAFKFQPCRSCRTFGYLGRLLLRSDFGEHTRGWSHRSHKHAATRSRHTLLRRRPSKTRLSSSPFKDTPFPLHQQLLRQLRYAHRRPSPQSFPPRGPSATSSFCSSTASFTSSLCSSAIFSFGSSPDGKL